MKKYHLEIVDSVYRPTIKDGYGPSQRVKVKGFRVRLIASNGEILQSSEQLESAASVKKHIEALGKVFAITAKWELYSVVKIKDSTKNKVWKNPF